MVTSAPMPPREGIGHYVWNLARFLTGQGHRAQVVTRGGQRQPFHEEAEGVPIWRPWFLPLYPLHVHLHALFAQRLVQHLEKEVDLYHLHTPLPPPLRTARPLVVTVHTPMLGEARSIPVSGPRSLMVRMQIPISACIERSLLVRAHEVVAVSRSVAEELRMYGLPGPGAKVFGNGVDTSLFSPGEEGRSTRAARQYVLAVGRLDVRKGVHDLVKAMAELCRRHPEVDLYIAGTGPLWKPLGTLVRRLGLPGTVHLLGHVERGRLIELYRGAVAFVHAAHYEGLPTVLLEAMACGKAVVSTGVSGALDVIDEGQNGLLVPPHAPARISAALCQLISDERLRDRLGRAARRTVEERFSWPVIGQRYLACYGGVVGELAG